MSDAFREFMGGLIDYAGLFPPAGLEMRIAVGNYLGYMDGEDRWMLGRFVCPAARLTELTTCLAGSDRAELPLSVILGDPDREPAVVRASLDEETGLIDAGAFEARLPQALAADGGPDQIASFVRRVGERLDDAGLGDRPVFIEAGLSRLSAVVEGIAGAGVDRVGLKIRCGGLEPAAFPPAESVARAIVCCRDGGIPWKATAGLHHAVRHTDEDVGALAHGFLNLFGAGILAMAHRLSTGEIVRILTDESPGSFRFEGDSFAWRDMAATAEETMVARFSFATSYGSCSFDMPREDLRLLGLTG